MDENNGDHSVSVAKLEANRRNAQKSTGPTTEAGKARSRRNALKHGVLTSALLITERLGVKDRAEFTELLDGLRNDLMPSGPLEEMLTEKIAVCWWRQKRALEWELELVPNAFGSVAPAVDMTNRFNHFRFLELVSRTFGAQMDRILRYETTIQRELVYSLNQLERLQRTRKGEHLPAPVSVQLSGAE